MSADEIRRHFSESGWTTFEELRGEVAAIEKLFDDHEGGDPYAFPWSILIRAARLFARVAEPSSGVFGTYEAEGVVSKLEEVVYAQLLHAARLEEQEREADRLLDAEQAAERPDLRSVS